MLMTADLIEPSADPLDPVPAPSCDWLGLEWYALQTNIRCEDRATAGLREKGFEVFYPVVRKWVRPRKITGPMSKRWRQIERPLFTRYIFVGFHGPANWYAVRATDGVESVVCVDRVPIVIQSSKIVDIFVRHSEGEFEEDQRPRRRRNPHRVGDHVGVDLSGLGEFPAIVTAAKPTAAAILVELLGSGVKMTVPLDKIREFRQAWARR